MKKRVARAILNLGTIRYVPISTKDGFFVIKFSGNSLLPFEKLSNEKDEFSFSQTLRIQSEDDPGYSWFPKPKNFCYVLHQNDFVERWEDQDKSNGMIENYLRNFYNKYIQAPEFFLDTLFTVKFKNIKWGISDSVDIPDFLIPRKGIKISSQAHWKHINKLLRDVGLLKEKRGTGRQPNEATKAVTDFIKQELRANNGHKILPRILKDRYDKHLRKKFIPLNNEDEMSDKEAKKAEEQIKSYERSEEQIRRIRNTTLKK